MALKLAFDSTNVFEFLRKKLSIAGQEEFILKGNDAFKNHRPAIYAQVANGAIYTWHLTTGNYFILPEHDADLILKGCRTAPKEILAKLISGGGKEDFNLLRAGSIPALKLTKGNAVVAVLIPEAVAYANIERQEEEVAQRNWDRAREIIKIGAESGMQINIEFFETGGVKRLELAPIKRPGLD